MVVGSFDFSCSIEILGGIFVLFAVFVYSCVLSCICLFLGSVVFTRFVAMGWGGLLQSSCLHRKQLGLSVDARFCTVYHRDLLKRIGEFLADRLS